MLKPNELERQQLRCSVRSRQVFVSFRYGPPRPKVVLLLEVAGAASAKERLRELDQAG